MDIIINKRFLKYKGHKFRCSIGKSGFSRSKKEGDLATPMGVFKLGTLYFRKDRVKSVKSKLRKKIIKKNMGWCDDAQSKKCNQEINFPFKYRGRNNRSSSRTCIFGGACFCSSTCITLST